MSLSPIQYRTVPSLQTAAQSLKMPTVQTKKIIKMKPSQLPALMMTSMNAKSQTPLIISTSQPSSQTFSSTVAMADNAQNSLEPTCGLFDVSFVDNMINETSPVYESTEEKFFTNDLLDYDHTTLNQIATDMDDLSKSKPKSKFAEKLSKLNIQKIKVPPKQSDQVVELNSADKILLNLNLDLDLKLITPNTEKQCFQLLHSIPTAQLLPHTLNQTPNNNVQSNELNTAHIITNEQIFQSIGFSEQDLAKLIANSPQVLQQKNNGNNPFLSEMSANLKLNSHNENKSSIIKSEQNVVSLDHVYSSSSSDLSAQKRKTCILSMEEGSQSYSQDSFVSSSMDVTSDEGGAVNKMPKRKRIKGIYRADDVTNEEEYMNYLERRKKNNMSSKISRANKKEFYHHMDYKADRMESDNEMLKEKIAKLTNINEIIKKELIQIYSGKKSD